VKRAFTLMELVLVIVVIGIISAVMVPRMNNVQIDKAAQQVLAHIRYTQHLAMMDNQFDPTDSNWFKKRWQIRFQTKHSHIVYTIYKDQDADGAGSPELIQDTIATNPQNINQKLTGRDDATNSGAYNKKMDLTKTYNIKAVSFSHCIGSKRIYFDYMGRAMAGDPASLDRQYYEENHNKNYLIQNECKVTLTDENNNKATITIEPETGYAYISKIER